jgi:ABC-2 type transport system ATP-binding protein
MMIPMSDVTISGLSKRFGELVAVDNLSLEVPKGTIFGLLGPNGAGKTTTVRMLCTLLKPSSGTAVVAGHDILTEPVAVRQNSGVLPEEGNHTLYPAMSARENLVYFAKLYGVESSEIDARIEELLKFMELWERRDDPAGELSSGNRQRLALCRALLHRPTVLLLDEPTSALDPIASKRVRELILTLSKTYGQTFFINSHNLAEVQRICDQIAIIDEGKVLLSGATEELRKRLSAKQKYRIRVVENIEEAERIAKQAEYVDEVTIEADTLVVKINSPYDNNALLMRALLDAGLRLVEFAEEEASLEDVYLETVKGGDR